MRSPSLICSLLHNLERSQVDPRRVLILASTVACSKEVFSLLSRVYPDASHEVRVLSPPTYLRYLYGLYPALQSSSSRGSGGGGGNGRDDFGRPSYRSSLASSLWQLPLGGLRPPTSPEKYLDPLASLFEDLVVAGVTPHEYLARSSQGTDMGEGEEPFSGARASVAASYEAWLHKHASGYATPMGVMSVLQREGEGGALRRAAHKDVQHLVCVNPEGFEVGFSRLLFALYGPNRWMHSSSLHTPPPPLSPPSAGAAPSATGTVTLYMDAGPTAPSGPWCRAPLIHRMVHAASLGAPQAPQSTTVSSSSGSGERVFTWKGLTVDHGRSLCSPSVVAVAEAIRHVSSTRSASASATWARKRAAAAAAAAAVSTAEESPTPPLPPPPPSTLLSLLPRGVRSVQRFPPPTKDTSPSLLPPGQGFVECVGIGPDLDPRAVVATTALGLARGEGGERSVGGGGSGGAPRTVAILCKSNAEVTAIVARLHAYHSQPSINHTPSSSSTTSTSPTSPHAPLPPTRVLVDAWLPLSRLPEVRWVLALLGVLCNTGDPQHWYTLATSPLYGIPTHTLGSWVREGAKDPRGGILSQAVRFVGRERDEVLREASNLRRQSEAGDWGSASGNGSSSFGGVGGGCGSDSELEMGHTAHLVGLGGLPDLLGAEVSSVLKSFNSATGPQQPRGDEDSPPLFSPTISPSLRAATQTSLLLTHLRSTLAHYHHSRSTLSTLRHYLDVSGLERVLSHPATPSESSASSGVAALLTLCEKLEGSGGDGVGGLRGGEGAISPALKRLRSSTRSMLGSGGGGGGGGGGEASLAAASGQPLEGLHLVTQGLTSSVYKSGAGFYLSSQGSNGGGGGVKGGEEGEDGEVFVVSVERERGGAWGPGLEGEEEGEELGLLSTLPLAGGGVPSSSKQLHILPSSADTLGYHTHLQIHTALDGMGGGGGGGSDPLLSEALSIPMQHLPPPADRTGQEGNSSGGGDGGGGGGGGGTVLVTTLRRGLSHMYDVVLLPGCSASTYPGNFTPSPLLPPHSVFAVEDIPEMPPSGSEGGAPPTPSPSPPTFYPPKPASREEKDAEMRWQVADAVLRAREGVVFFTPAPHPNYPVTSASNRSKFLERVFPPLPDYHLLSSSSSTAHHPPPSPSPGEGGVGGSNEGSMAGGVGIHACTPTPTIHPPQFTHPSPPPSPAPRLSYSAVSDYEWCPQKYRFSRVDGLTSPPSLPMLYGGALHSAMALCGEWVGAVMSNSVPLGPHLSLTSPAIDIAAHALGVLTSTSSAEGEAARGRALSTLPALEGLQARMMEAYRQAWVKDDKRTWRAGESSPLLDPPSSLSLTPHPVDPMEEHLTLASRKTGFPEAQLRELHGVALDACVRFAGQEVGRAREWLSGGGGGGGGGAVVTPSLPALIESKFEVLVGGGVYAPKVRVSGVIDRVDVCRSLVGGGIHLRVREFKSSQQWKRKGSTGKSPLALMMDRSIQANVYALALNSMRVGEGWTTPLTPMGVGGGGVEYGGGGPIPHHSL